VARLSHRQPTPLTRTHPTVTALPSLLTLNLSRPPDARARGLLEYLWHRDEDLLVLTETGLGGGSALVESVCRSAGFSVQSSLSAPTGRRRRGLDPAALGVLVVARAGALVRDEGVPEVAVLPERVLTLRVGAGPDSLRLIAVYGAASDPVRYSSSVQRQRKRDWLLAFCTWLSQLPPAPTVIVGDLNIVAPGHPDKLACVLDQERTAYDLITGPLGFVDAYAAAHARSGLAGEPTWVDHSGVGCRYDYLLAGPGVPSVGDFAIDHTPRLAGLTDHSALFAHL